MSEQEYNNEEIPESQSEATTDLDEEVGDVTVPETDTDANDEDQEEVFDDTEESYDAENEDSDDDSADEEAGEPAKPVSDQDKRFDKMSQQMEQLQGVVTAMASFVQQGGQQQAPVQQPAPQRVVKPHITMPEDVDDYSPQQTIQYAVEQSQEQNNAVMNELVNNLSKRLNIYDNLLDTALQGHPQKQMISDALVMMQKNPTISFQMAMQTADGLAAKKQVSSLQKQSKQSQKAQRKRKVKARRGSTRPTQVQKPKSTRVPSIREAVDAAEARAGR